MKPLTPQRKELGKVIFISFIPLGEIPVWAKK